MKTLDERIEESVDVSGAYDNCFFHTYAAHLIANNLSFPEELFSFYSILGDNSHASMLQKRFPNRESLSIFADYHKGQYPDDHNSEHEFIVEKTLILGFLLREWFATKMVRNETIREEMEGYVKEKFNVYINFRRSGVDREDLLSGEEGLLYEANSKFLEYMVEHPVADPTPEQSRFESYVTVAEGDIDRAFERFWKDEGYYNYCSEIAKPRVKLSYREVLPVINLLEQPMTIYNRDGVLVYENEIENDTPKLEVALFAVDGHYHLLKTNDTAQLLDEYSESYQNYMIDREDVLSAIDNKEILAETKPSLLVASICPAEHLLVDPFQSLLNKVDTIKKSVTIDNYLSDYANQIDTIGYHSEDAKLAAQEIYNYLKERKIVAFCPATPDKMNQFAAEVLTAFDERKERLKQDFGGWHIVLNIIKNILNTIIQYMPFVHTNEFFKPHVPQALINAEQLKVNIQGLVAVE